MTCPNKRYLVHLFFLLCVFCFPVCGAALPSAVDINALSKKALHISSEFKTQSADIRLRHEYTGKFVSEDDREKMSTLAAEAINKLRAIRISQQRSRRVIEDYEGSDWDRRFGENLLWRKLCTDIDLTQWLECNVKYYLALSQKDSQRAATADQIIRSCQTENNAGNTDRRLLRAKTFAMMAAANKDYHQIAENEIELIFAGSLNNRNYVEAAMLKIALADKKDAKKFWRGHRAMMQKKCKDDPELNFRLGLCGLGQGDKDVMADLIASNSQWRQLFGKVVLNSIAENSLQELKTKTPFEIEAAVMFLRSKGPKGYNVLLERLCSIERFRTAVILYATAESLQGWSDAKAVERFIDSAKMRRKESNASIDLSCDEIALKAAITAYELYNRDADQLDIAEKAVEFYLTISRSDVDEDVEYLYTSLLDEAGKNVRAQAHLERIADGSGKYAQQAKLDLIERALKYGTAERAELLNELLELIDLTASDKENDNVRVQATGLYCQLRLEDGKQLGAKEVLDLLDRTPSKNQMHQDLLRADALQRLDRPMEAVDILAETLEPDRCQGRQLGAAILARIVEDADLYAGQMQNCKKLAALCMECCQGQLKEAVELIWAEITIVEGPSSAELARTERIVNAKAPASSIERLRCKARLLAAQGQFDQAMATWRQIATNYKPLNAAAKRRPKQWWRAKYYELWCFARTNSATKPQIRHAVEVIESSLSDIPAYWTEKLSQLKE